MSEKDICRHAIVTGAGNGLGRAFCEALADLGWKTAITDLDTQAAEQTQTHIESLGGTGEVFQLDVTSESGWRQLYDQLRESWPRLDLLINNAGICASGDVDSMTSEMFRRVLDVNLIGVQLGCHTMVPWLKETRP